MRSSSVILLDVTHQGTGKHPCTKAMLTATDLSVQLLLPPGEKALGHDALPSGWADRFPGGDCKGKGDFQILNIMLHPRRSG